MTNPFQDIDGLADAVAHTSVTVKQYFREKWLRSEHGRCYELDHAEIDDLGQVSLYGREVGTTTGKPKGSYAYAIPLNVVNFDADPTPIRYTLVDMSPAKTAEIVEALHASTEGSNR